MVRQAALCAALASTFALPAAARAAVSKPAVTTGGAAQITFAGARLTGTVDPNGAATTYVFRYGPSNNFYTNETPAGTLSGDGRKTVTADITGLAPATVYHYRLIASNSAGKTEGSDRAFKTKNQPLGVTFTATPNPVLTGGGSGLSGQLTGTGNAQRQVILESNPFPYTQGFKQVGSPIVTDQNGNFTFNSLAVPINTQFRVRLPDKPSVVSPIVVISVQPKVSTHVTTTRVTRGGRLTFSGTITPALDGTPIAIQKLSKGHWVTVAGTVAHHRSASSSAYKKRIRIRRGGTYRVYVGVVNGQYVPNTGREIKIRTHR
jgi:hypothetical protein